MNRLHPLSALTTALNRGIVGASIPFVIIWTASLVIDFVEMIWAVYLAPFAFIAGVAYGIAYYYRFEYGLTDDTFDLSYGVIARRSREIPYHRIQNVDVTQSIIYQLLSISVVNVETAGGGNTEAMLNFVSESEADRLQREIRRLTAESKRRRTAGKSTERAVEEADLETDRDEAKAADPVAEETPTTLFKLASKELLLYSFTSFRLPLAAAVIFIAFLAFDTVSEFVLRAAEPFGGPADLEGSITVQQYGILSAISVVYGVAVTYVFSVIYTFMAYFDFKLGRAGEDLVYERGLLQRYSGSIPVEKVQSITVTDNPIQRAIEYAGLWIETAGYGPESGGASQSAIPLAEKRRSYWFAERLTGVEAPTFSSPSPIARRRYLARYSIICGVVVAIAIGVSIFTAFERWWWALIVFVGVPPAAYLRWKHIGYYFGEDHLVVRAGFWRRRTTVIPYYRLQSVSTRRSIFQRRLGLASLVLDTASSRTFFWATPTVYDLELSTARTLHERARKSLERSIADRHRDEDSAGVSVDFT